MDPDPAPQAPNFRARRGVRGVRGAWRHGGLGDPRSRSVLLRRRVRTVPADRRQPRWAMRQERGSVAVELAIVAPALMLLVLGALQFGDRKSTRLNSSHVKISYAVFCLK